MADQPAAPGALLPDATIPPTMAAAHHIITTGLSEISVTFGQTRWAPQAASPTAQVNAIPYLEWFATISMSPPVAKQVRDGLSKAIDAYEEQFGVIPTGPTAPVPTPPTTTVSRQSFKPLTK